MNQDQAIGSLLGLAIGDALGTTLEFQRNPSADRSTWQTEIIGNGPFQVPVGGWTDDTSMALALGYAYKHQKGFDPETIAQYFLDWWLKGKYSWANECIDIGGATRTALTKINQRKQGDSPYQGSTHPSASGNGGIMRLAPAVIANALTPAKAIEEAISQSRITHASDECCHYADRLARVLLAGDPFIREVEDSILPDTTPWEELPNGGYVKDTFETAMWAARNSNSFEECLLLAVNRRGDADTIGAVAGQIAGAQYGYNAIPHKWRQALLWRDDMVYLATCLFDLAEKSNPKEESLPLDVTEAQKERTKSLHQFLKDNVAIYETPETVIIRNITIDWGGPGISGTFMLTLDNIAIADPVTFGIEQNGKAKMYYPMFHSPCGVPCSYAAMELTKATEKTINQLLTSYFPKIKPCSGSGGAGGISYNDGLSKRTNSEDYNAFFIKSKKPCELIAKVVE